MFERSDNYGFSMSGMGEVEPEYVPSFLGGGAFGWPDSPQQKMDGTVVAAYAQKLRDIGYDAPVTGNARDPELMQQVAFFQQYKELEVDGLLGPMTNAAIDKEWNAMNAGPAPGFEPPPTPQPDPPPPFVPGDLPPYVAPSGPNPLPPPLPPPLEPVVDVDEDSNTGLLVALGLGVAVLGTAAYFLLSD